MYMLYVTKGTRGPRPLNARSQATEVSTCFHCQLDVPTALPLPKIVLGSSIHCSNFAGRKRIRESWARDATDAGLIFHFFVTRSSLLCPDGVIDSEAATYNDMVILGEPSGGPTTSLIARSRKLISIISHVSSHPDVDVLVVVNSQSAFIDARRLAGRLRTLAASIDDSSGIFGGRFVDASIPRNSTAVNTAWFLTRPAVRKLADAAAGGVIDSITGAHDQTSALLALLHRSAPEIRLLHESGIAPCPDVSCLPENGTPPWAVELTKASRDEATLLDGGADGPAGLRSQPRRPVIRDPEVPLWTEFVALVRGGSPLLPKGTRCCAPQ